MKSIVIAGPTASGKTALGVLTAQKMGGEVISADSMQIYREIPIASARPDEKERGGIPHHLMGFCPFDQPFSVVDWREKALAAAQEITARGKIPVFVGGTGLYLHSLLYQTDFASPSSPAVRAELEKKETGELYALLKEKEPDTRLAPGDRKRIVRALEVWTLTGQAMPKNEWKQRDPSFDALLVTVSPERETLYERIEKRVEEMLERGLEDEVRALLAQGANETHQIYKAIGVRQWADCLAGRATREETVEAIKRDSRRYAKRQLTWMRASTAVWLTGETTEEREKEIERLYGTSL